MGRKTKETYYRKYFEGKKLNEALNTISPFFILPQSFQFPLMRPWEGREQQRQSVPGRVR